MAKPRSHKTQHLISTCYLEAWCDPETPAGHEPYVHVFPLNGGKPRRRAPKNLFQETDTYTITGKEGARNLQLEALLSRIETQFPAIREKLEKMQELTGEQFGLLLFFVAAMHARTARMREHDRLQWGRVKRVADDIEQAMQGKSPEERRRYVSPTVATGGPSLTHSHVNEIVKAPLQRLMLPRIIAETEVLAKMKLAVLCAVGKERFLTSDAPCVWLDPMDAGLPPLQQGRLGMMAPTLQITLPLSPNIALFISRDDSIASKFLDSNDEHVIHINSRTIFCCNTHFVSQSAEINELCR